MYGITRRQCMSLRPITLADVEAGHAASSVSHSDLYIRLVDARAAGAGGSARRFGWVGRCARGYLNLRS